MKRAKEGKSKEDKKSKESKKSSTVAPAAAAEESSGLSGTRYILRYLLLAFGVYLMWRRQDTEKSTILAAKDVFRTRGMNVTCAKDYGSFPGCSPQFCGRVVMDNFVSEADVGGLLDIAKRGMEQGGGAGGATILDLHSGALSRGKEFVNIYKSAKGSVFTKDDFELYKKVKNRVKRAVEEQFAVRGRKLYLTHPTFFSRMNSKPAVTSHDEYWHPHIDRTTYPSFFYTSLLYLTTAHSEFEGGAFVFLDKHSNHTIEPRAGRLSFFTSGSENVHRVTPVALGTRYAITISFTCDKKFAIEDPSG